MTITSILLLALFAWYYISSAIEGKKRYEEQKKINAEQKQKDRENIYKAIQDLAEKLNETLKEKEK